ncbi:MAG: hypothetical protein WCI39_07690 [Gallionellaceae bacterium]
MNYSKDDLLKLKWSLLTFLISLALSASAIWIGSAYDANSLKARQSAQKQVVEARTKLSSTQSDLDNMSTYALEYTSLVNNKIVGDETRLDWIEGLEKLRQQRHVLDFKYTIAPQKDFVPSPALDTGNFSFSLSGANLQLDLLHEGQLNEFFEALRGDMKGWFIIDQCSLERIGTANTAETLMNNTGPQLKASCAGGWVTMKNRNAP